MADLEASFLRAILASPHEDAHRLVYADWLEERDQPGDDVRAEFIRLQVMIDGAPMKKVNWNVGIGEWLRMKDRAALLLADNQVRWRQHLPDGWANWVTTFRRGFIEDITLSAQDFFDCAADLFSMLPILRVELTNWQPVQVQRREGIRWMVGSAPDHAPIDLLGPLLHDSGYYASSLDCLDVMNRAFVDTSRRLTGLPPLPSL